MVNSPSPRVSDLAITSSPQDTLFSHFFHDIIDDRGIEIQDALHWKHVVTSFDFLMLQKDASISICNVTMDAESIMDCAKDLVNNTYENKRKTEHAFPGIYESCKQCYIQGNTSIIITLNVQRPS